MTERSCCMTALETETGSCTFGCGAVVDRDTGICPICHDHSANRIECETCGRAFEDWNGKWEPADA